MLVSVQTHNQRQDSQYECVLSLQATLVWESAGSALGIPVLNLHGSIVQILSIHRALSKCENAIAYPGLGAQGVEGLPELLALGSELALNKTSNQR
jgi:hypothetical protein